MKPNQELTPENIALALQAILSNQSGASSHPVMDLLNKRLMKQDAEETEALRVAKEGQRQNAQAMELNRKNQEQLQAGCPHLKPNGMPNIAAQRDHSNNYNYICQRCFKPWQNNELPGHLAIDPQFIGGPQL